MSDKLTPEDARAIGIETDNVEERLTDNAILNAELIAEVKKQVTAEIVSEMKEKRVYEEKEKELRQEQEDLEHANYVATMKESDEPWVEMVGDVRDTQKGQRVQLEWNNAFISHLKDAGFKGVDDEQIIQQYLAMLLRDTTDKYEDRYGSDYE